MTELTTEQLKMIAGGSDTVTGKVKYGQNNDSGTHEQKSETTTGTVKY